MSQVIETSIPPAPRGLRKDIKREWARMAKMMVDQGLDPADRIDLLESYVAVVAEEDELAGEWGNSGLLMKLALGRRLSVLLNQKLRVRALLFKRTRGGG
jgi:hypothetical protein